MRGAREIVVNTLCLFLAGALVSLPATVRAAPQAAGSAVELERLGVSPAEAQARVAALDDSELEALATDLDGQPAGGDSDSGDVAVAFLVITGVVFIVLIITDATGVTDIFPWVKKPGERRR
jgi:hypothetical protein